jgi:hypothetical protein
MQLSSLISALPTIAFCLCFFNTIIAYLVSRKGLNRYPSLTPLCTFSDLGYVLHNYILRLRQGGPTRTEALYELHKVHPIIRLGPNRLSFSDLAAVKDIYGTGTKCQKGDQYTTPGGPPNLLTAVDRGLHAMKRKRMAAAFATSHLVDWEHKIVDKIQILLNQVDARCGVPVDWRLWSNLFTLDAIMDIALSHRSGFLESGNDITTAVSTDGKEISVQLRESLQAVNRAVEPIVWSPELYPIIKGTTKLFPTYRGQWSAASAWRNIVRHAVDTRIVKDQKGQRLDDLFTCLLYDGGGKSIGLAQSELEAETSHFRTSKSPKQLWNSRFTNIQQSRCRFRHNLHRPNQLVLLPCKTSPSPHKAATRDQRSFRTPSSHPNLRPSALPSLAQSLRRREHAAASRPLRWPPTPDSGCRNFDRRPLDPRSYSGIHSSLHRPPQPRYLPRTGRVPS